MFLYGDYGVSAVSICSLLSHKIPVIDCIKKQKMKRHNLDSLPFKTAPGLLWLNCYKERSFFMFHNLGTVLEGGSQGIECHRQRIKMWSVIYFHVNRFLGSQMNS